MKLSDSIDPHKLTSSKLKALWALDQLEYGDRSRFTSSELANFLIEKHGVDTSRQAIEYALKVNKGKTHKDKNGYKLMEKGRNELRAVFSLGKVIVVEPGKPFSAKNIELKKIFSSLSGEILISDPYLDIHMLDIIFKNVDSSISVKILTENVADKPAGIFTRHLAELRKEGYKINIGIYSNSTLHDRYIMDSTTFWFSGNSLNHLGEKESFLVLLGEDIHKSMLSTFNSRWKASQKI